MAEWPHEAATCIDVLSFLVFVFIRYDQQTFENNLILSIGKNLIRLEMVDYGAFEGKQQKQMFILIMNQ